MDMIGYVLIFIIAIPYLPTPSFPFFSGHSIGMAKSRVFSYKKHKKTRGNYDFFSPYFP